MRKKILSAIALTMAMTLTFGMSVFATESPAVKGETIVVENVKAEIAEVTGTEAETLKAEATTFAADVASVTVSGSTATVAPVAAAELKSAKEVATQMAVTAKGAGATTSVVAAVDVTVTGFAGGNVTINLAKAVDPAKTIVMHLNNGAWETMKAEISADGKSLTAYFSGLSPIVVVEVAAANDATGVSPKTGEVLPLAGILAVICLAGVAVSAKKVRYNR